MGTHQFRYNEQEFKCAVESSITIGQVLTKLGLVAAGGNYVTVKKLIRKYELDTSHFKGQSWAKGTSQPARSTLPLHDILVENSTYSNTCLLKERLIRAGLMKRKCANCSLTEWMGCPITLELDHINGKRSDNRLKNLRLLCPNCHSLTDTFRGRNIKRLQR